VPKEEPKISPPKEVAPVIKAKEENKVNECYLNMIYTRMMMKNLFKNNKSLSQNNIKERKKSI